MKRHFPLYPPHLPSLFPCSYFDSVSICVGSHACNFTIPHFFFLPTLKKNGKGRREKEAYWEFQSYYSAACMYLLIFSFHLWSLLYWQMVVIREYGNTVVRIVFTGFFPLVFMTWWSSWERCGLEQSSSAVWIKEVTFATWKQRALDSPECLRKLGRVRRVCLLHCQSVNY